MDHYENDALKAAEYKRCSLYVELGAFHKNVTAAQIDGTDAGMYGAYWHNLSALKAMNDEAPDREFITLRIYREIATRVAEYAKYFMEDGVEGEELLAMLQGIEEDMWRMEQGATSAAQQEIDAIRWIVGAAHRMVRSTYNI